MNGMKEDEEWRYQEIPEEEDCSHGLIPAGAEPMAAEGTEAGEDDPEKPRRIRVADGLNTIGRVFFQRYRLELYQYMNQCLRKGTLAKTAGFPIRNRVINREVCEFTGWDVWRLDRCNFIFDTYVTLTLATGTGEREWKGILTAYCGFGDDLECWGLEISDADSGTEEKGRIRLSSYLVPYLKSEEIDAGCEEMLREYLPGTELSPDRIDAEELANRMGLTVMHVAVHKAGETCGILFFEEGELEEKSEQDPEEHPPKRIKIPANTIVVNVNKVPRGYSNMTVFHECVHDEYHYLFYRLQKMNDNDLRNMNTREIDIGPEEEITDPIYWMEKQANRGAYGLRLPCSWIREQVPAEVRKVMKYETPRHRGELYEKVGIRLCTRHRIANFQMRARMIQMGFIEAKGSLNWVSGRRIEPFAFELDAGSRVEDTFVISFYGCGRLYEESEDFRKLYDTGRFIHADGHVVRNDPQCVEEREGRLMLTGWANAHVDRCCLRFQRIYVQSSLGKYIFGRMNFDSDYAEKTRFYLGDLVNQEMLNEMEAEEKYKAEFPKTFGEGVKKLAADAKLPLEELGERLGMDRRTFFRWLADPGKQHTVDFVMMISLILELPDWISALLFDRAYLTLSSSNPRHLALKWIQRAMWKDGMNEANEYLKSRGFEPLHI